MASLFIYSCADDATTFTDSMASDQNAQIESRESRKGSQACFDPFSQSSECQNSILLGTDTMQFQIYGNCTFVAIWTTWQCLSIDLNENKFYTVVMTDFSAEPVSGSCDSLTNLWDNYANSNQDALLLQSMQDFEVEASLIVERYTIENSVPVIFEVNCGEVNSTQLFTEFYRSICNQLYKYKVVKGKLEYYKFETVSCADVCCARETEYCSDSNGVHQVGQVMTSVIGQCFSDTPTSSPGIGYIAVGACESNCSK